MPSSTSSSEAGAAGVRLLALMAAVAGLISLGLGLWLAAPPSAVSEQRYLAAIKDKLAMLEASKGEEGRVVLIGGSGAAFSISAEQLTRDLDRPVYNGGLQASMGFRNLVDLYAPALDPERDLIVLLPEPEMLADDEHASTTWCDAVFLLKDLTVLAGTPRCVPGVLWRSWQEGQHHLGDTPQEDRVYRRSGFNARGDLVSHLGLEGERPDFSEYDHPTIPAPKLDAIAQSVERTLRGFTVLYIPAAMPEAGCARSPGRVQAMVARLGALSSGAAGPPDAQPFCLSPELFFDGAGHLNKRGRDVQTRNVAIEIANFDDDASTTH